MTHLRKIDPVSVLIRLAAPTFGWFRSADAHAAGVTSVQLHRLRRRGVVESPCRGINHVAAYPDSWEARALAALWTAGAHAALGRHAALRILRGTSASPDVDVVVPRGVNPTVPSVAVRTSCRLRAEDVVVRGPFRVTSPAFTLCDLAAVASVSALVRAADRFVAASQLSPEELHGMVARFAWIEGVAKLRLVLAELEPALRWTRSDGERAFARILVAAGIRLPRANARVRVGGRRRYLDYAYDDLRILIELDLHPSHGTTVGRRADGARQNALVLDGWTVLRFDLADLMLRPDLVARTVAGALERAAAAGVS